ncbi:RidA family protein [Thermomonospora umbrina]|uniref:Enamine deaminase RidA (YjgF/YER057c/UK114 family) n=1 Tax=Thermomonospora umbrina TaxID=111806 RepID=A0A3D9SMG3_9ACTN|nr:RidA family protein [Thermomonospora umbrina]REE97112.1 enamine deaminase RidA (YjgF/YER057c/UK114 family) [Thermomonospora umbrina]
MSTPEERIAELGFELPEVVPPLASYVPAVRVGSLVHTSGQLPFVKGELPVTGKVGAEVTPERAAEMAALCALNALAALRSEIGELSRVTRIVKVVGYVASAPDFYGQPQVINGASDLLGRVFGDAGRHARAAVGVTSLPMNTPVELDLVACL